MSLPAPVARSTIWRVTQSGSIQTNLFPVPVYLTTCHIKTSPHICISTRYVLLNTQRWMEDPLTGISIIALHLRVSIMHPPTSWTRFTPLILQTLFPALVAMQPEVICPAVVTRAEVDTCLATRCQQVTQAHAPVVTQKVTNCPEVEVTPEVKAVVAEMEIKYPTTWLRITCTTE